MLRYGSGRPDVFGGYGLHWYSVGDASVFVSASTGARTGRLGAAVEQRAWPLQNGPSSAPDHRVDLGKPHTDRGRVMSPLAAASGRNSAPAVRRQQAPCGPELSLAFRLSRGRPMSSILQSKARWATSWVRAETRVLRTVSASRTSGGTVLTGYASDRICLWAWMGGRRGR